MRYLIFLFLSFFIMISCNNDKKSNTTPQVQQTTSEKSITKKENHPGKKLLETNCYTCHNPTAPKEARLAPLFSEVKQAYNPSKIKEKHYVKSMMNWIKDPKKSTSKMPKMIEKYGLMPKMTFSKEDEKLIAEYLYHYDPSVEVQEELLDGEFNYKKEGKRLSLTTKKQLGKNLMYQLNNNGTREAVSFCNIKAFPIVDSMSTVLDASISRVSDKPRNKKNQANKIEKKYLETYHEAIAKGEEMKPIVEHKGNEHTYYAPITTNPMCIQCHGNIGADVKPDVSALLNKLYPTDKAIGYSSNQVRGLWKVVMTDK